MNSKDRKWELFNNLPEGVIIIDSDLRIIFANLIAREALGEKGENIINSHLPDLWPKGNQAKLKQAIQRSVKTNRHHQYSDHLPFAFSEKSPLVVCCFPMDNQLLLRLRKSTLDEALFYQNQRTLEELSAYKAALNESTILAITDLKGTITYANDNFCKISKYSREELIGQPHSIINSGYHSKAFFKDMWKTIGNGSIWKGQFKNKAKDGTEYWVNTSIVPFLNEKGKPYQYLAIREDITEKKKIEMELVKSNRLYQFTSSINRSIVQIKDKNKLIENLCEVTNLIGQFSLNWLSLIKDNSVILHTAQGDQSIIKKLINLNATPIEQLKFSNSLVERIQQTKTSQHFDYFEELGELVKAGSKEYDSVFKSKLAFPILVFNQVVGLWFVFSEEEIVFDHSEKYLLEEAAMDVSYALENIWNLKQKERIENNLLKSEKRFRFLIEKSKDIKLIADKEGAILYISPSVTTYLGYELDEMIGMVGQTIVHPDDLSIYLSERNRIIQVPGSSYNLIIRLRHKNGEYIWVDCVTTNWLEEPGIHGLVSNFFEITEKKKIEEARVKDEMNLKALINNTSDLIWSIDKEFRLITCNLAYSNLLFVTHGKQIKTGDFIFDYLLDPKLLNQYQARFQRAFNGESFTDLVYFDLDVPYWLEISFYPIFNGNSIEGVACFAKDVTEKRKAEEDLRRSESKLKEAQSIAHMGNWELDFSNNRAYWSEELQDILGYESNENFQTIESWKELIHPDDLDRILEKVNEQQINLENASFDYRIIRKDQTIRYLHSESKIKTDGSGNLIGLFGISIDITEQKKAEHLLELTLAQLEERIAERTKEITQKNINILDSINSAKRIQLGLLANQVKLKEIFEKSFVINLPRDIVSGDFFWVYQRRNKKYLVVADCTGHGVPGALMSIIGTNLLNQIVVNEHYENPSEILELLDIRLKYAVQGNDKEVKDGMDLSLCIVDYYFNELYFAGANNQVYLSTPNGAVDILKADRMAIGGGSNEEFKRFETKRISFQSGQRIYLSSDGFASQFGGKSGKKYMKERFRKLLESCSEIELIDQGKCLEQEFNEWKGLTEQVDDVMIVGVEL